MKTLIIVRHAKSSWEFPELSDDQRPLLEKGKKRTRKVINHLNKAPFDRPDLIISSHAVRALETARIFAHALGVRPDEIQVSKTLYHGDAEMILDQLYGINDEIQSVMLVGHNPTLTSFANLFLPKPIEWIPTSGVVILKIPVGEWTEVGVSKATHSQKIFPKEL